MKTSRTKMLSLVFSLISGAALAADVTLDLNVSGTILAGPEWQDSSDSQITSVTFDFSSFQAGTASRHVDSSSATAKLAEPSSPSGSLNVALVTPSGCAIGSSSVIDSDVKLIVNSVQQANGATVSIQESASNTLSLRFASSGSYGDKAGSVSCSSAGSLTYTY